MSSCMHLILQKVLNTARWYKQKRKNKHLIQYTQGLLPYVFYETYNGKLENPFGFYSGASESLCQLSVEFLHLLVPPVKMNI